MKTAYVTKQFKKDVRLAQKRRKEISKLKNVMALIVEEHALAEKHKDHPLSGSFSDYRECHMEPDWLLIYKLTSSSVYFVRTGTHADLFG